MEEREKQKDGSTDNNMDSLYSVYTQISTNTPLIKHYTNNIRSNSQEPTDTSNRPIRNRYLGHATGYQPIRYQYLPSPHVYTVPSLVSAIVCPSLPLLLLIFTMVTGGSNVIPLGWGWLVLSPDGGEKGVRVYFHSSLYLGRKGKYKRVPRYRLQIGVIITR